MGRLLDLDDFLDPKSLTPQELYRLQSETWAQGVDYENERIIKLLEEHTHPEAEAEYLIDCDLCERYYGVGLALALISKESRSES